MSLASSVVSALSATSLGGGKVIARRGSPDGPAVPPGIDPPYVRLYFFGDSPDLRGDVSTLAYRELVQVSLFEREHEESRALRHELVGVLDGLRADTGERLRYSSSTRAEDPDVALVQHALTFDAVRSA